MAGIQLNITGKVKASSVLEVIISMVVIVIVFSIAMGIFANVQRLSLSVQKIHARCVLQNEILKVKQSLQTGKQIHTIEDFSVEQEVTNYNNNNKLYQVNLFAYDVNGNKLAELKEVIYRD